MNDLIVIGAGPAGISAALYAKRSGTDVKVLYSGESYLEKAEKIENYYGFANGISGKELYEIGIKQAQNLKIPVLEEEVIDIMINKNNLFNILTNKAEYSSKAIILATGNKKIRPQIQGIEKYEGKGISYCAICDGFFYKNKNIAIIGNSQYALNEASHLENIVANITLLTNGKNINMDCKYNIDKRKIKKIMGNEKVNEIIFEDGNILNIDGIFIAEGIAGGANFSKKLGIALNGDNIIVDENMKTNINGIFACGDITGNLLQISKAIYEGAKAGISASKFLKHE